TGQHILSQAFLQTAAAATVSFHLSDETVTIDLDKPDLTEKEIAAAEQLANEIVWQNRPIHIRFVSPEEAATLPLRKRPPAHNGRLRLIEIADFDLSACGGTHVRHTGEVGQIKVIRRERRGEGWRVEFRCGGRALDDYGRKNQIITALADILTTAPEEFTAAIEKLQAENKQARRQLRKLQTAALAWEAQELLETAQPFGDGQLILRVFADGRDPGQLRQLGNHFAQHPGVIAFLGLAGDKTHLVFCRHAKAPGDMGQLLHAALTELNGRGGGKPDFAQGGAPQTTKNQIQQILEKTAQNL
ncbi:MAG: DHHA1 domain-containing protein, partial [Anaerolineae bacterium]